MATFRSSSALAAGICIGLGLAVLIGAQRQGAGGAAAADPVRATGAEPRKRVAVLVPRDPTGFNVFFDAGAGSAYKTYRVVAAFPFQTDQVYIVLEGPQK
jgi:hypothetical protein